MTPQAYIFMGPSGSGKGTQVQLFKQVLEQKTPDTKILHVDTGLGFRKLFTENTFTTSLIKESINNGNRQPDALATFVVVSKLIYEMEKNQHVILDGSPRTVFQAEAIDELLKFYSFEKPVVILMNVDREELKKRLILRKRTDDTVEGIEKRLAWYENEVVPAVNYYKDKDYYTFVEVNGEQSVEDVHKEILSKTGLA